MNVSLVVQMKKVLREHARGSCATGRRAMRVSLIRMHPRVFASFGTPTPWYHDGMQEDVPAVRANYAKSVIATMKRRPADERDALLSHLDARVRRVIREAGRLEWIPVAELAALATVVAEALGRERALRFWRDDLQGSLERTLLSPLRLGAIALYGDAPSSLLRMTPQAWQLVTRNCGTCRTVDTEPGAMTLRFDGLPPELRTPAMLLLWSGGCDACIQRMQRTGRSDGQLDTQASAATLHVRWDSR